MTKDDKTIVEEMFDSFCKKVIRNVSRDIKRYKRAKNSNEMYLSLYDPSILGCYMMDEYPSLFNQLVIRDRVILIRDDRLFAAISSLKDTKKYIIILSYWEKMNDREISDFLHMPQRTVQYNRTTAITDLKKIFDKNNDTKGEKNGK